MAVARSYSSRAVGMLGRARELWELTRRASRPQTDSALWVLGLCERTRERVLDRTGVRLTGLRGLEIGPGQQAGCLRCFGIDNDMVGIDTDVIARGSNVIEYFTMLRHNGSLRLAKTLARKALRVDARFDQALEAELNAPLPTARVERMSATAMTFSDASFDFAYSHSVFEHIDDPAKALTEVARVLRTGGVAYIGIHLYTSHSGAHDPKTMGVRPAHPLWAHLRPAWAHTSRPNAYVNRLRIHEWKQIFSDIMPGATFVNERQDDEIGDGLDELRKQGELTEYSDEELMTVNLVAIWQKPRAESKTVEAAATPTATVAPL